MRFVFIVLAFYIASSAHAQEQNKVEIWQEGKYLMIISNGIPTHQTGQFPNGGNPHSISGQNYQFRIPLEPRQ
jgi:hypothetical protein